MCNEGQSSARWNSKKKQFSLSDCRRFSSRCFHLSEVEMWYLATGTRRMVNSSQGVIYRLFCYHPRTEDWKLITQRVCGCFIPLKQNVKLSKSFSCSTNFDCVSLAATPSFLMMETQSRGRSEAWSHQSRSSSSAACQVEASETCFQSLQPTAPFSSPGGWALADIVKTGRLSLEERQERKGLISVMILR